MTGKRTTQSDSVEPAAVEEPSAPPVLDLRKLYADQIKNMELLMAEAARQGITLGEAPPVETVAVRAVGDSNWKPGNAGGPNHDGSDAIPWRHDDLDPKDVYDLVPQFIPSIVHPLLDENRKPRIFLTVNGMTCCLTVGVLNKNVSGSFYWAYMNAEELYRDSEEFKLQGPKSAPWSSQGPGGTSSWHHEPVAPNAWIDLNGRYYTPGAPMPDTTGSE